MNDCDADVAGAAACGALLAARAKNAALPVVPRIPRAKGLFERAILHAREQHGVRGIAQGSLVVREHGDVVAECDRRIDDHEATCSPQRALGNDVIEEHRVHATRDEIGVGMHVVVVRHRYQPGACLLLEQDLVCTGRAERADAVPGKIGERAELRGVGWAYREHLAKLVVRNTHGVARAKLGTVFQSRHADVEITTLHGLFDRCPGHLHELWLSTEPLGDHARNLDVEAAHDRRIRRVGFNERRATLGVTTPAEFLRCACCLWRRAAGAEDHCREEESGSHCQTTYDSMDR